MPKKVELNSSPLQEPDNTNSLDEFKKVTKLYSDLKQKQGKSPRQNIKVEDQQEQQAMSEEPNKLPPELVEDKPLEISIPSPLFGGDIFLFGGGSGDWAPTSKPDKIPVSEEVLIDVEKQKTPTEGATGTTKKCRSPFSPESPVDNFSPNLSLSKFSFGSCSPSPIPKMSNEHSNHACLLSSSFEEGTASPSPKGKTVSTSVDPDTDSEKIEKVFEEKLVPGTISSPMTCTDSSNVKLSHSERLGMLFETGSMGDFWVRLGHVRRDKPSSRSVKVHKAIISASSPVFREMIRRAEADGVDFIVVKDIEVRWEAFRTFLKYFYTGSIDMQKMESASHIQNLFEICTLAKTYCVIDLKENCESILESKYLNQNPVEIMHRAAECSSFLENLALQCILRNGVDILESEEFLKLNVFEICKIFGSNDLVVFNEDQVFSSLLRWGASQCEETVDPSELRKVIQIPLRFVRFSTMKVQDFVNKVVEKDILSSDQVVDIMKTFVPGKRQSSRDYICQDSVVGFNRFASRKAISVFRPSDVPDVIRFRVNDNIRLLAVGVIAESDDGEGLFEITVTVEDENSKLIASTTKTYPSSKQCHLISLKTPAGVRIHENMWYTISGYVTPLDDGNHKIIFGVGKHKSKFVFDYTKTDGAKVHQKKLRFTLDEKEDPMCRRNFGDFGILDEIHFLAR